MNKFKGFSLIELMVVIAIVAILSAIAVPAYKNYITRVKLAQAMDFMSTVGKQSRVYYSQKGVYPTAADLGYNTSGTSVSNHTQYVPFASAIAISSEPVTGPCAGLATRGVVMVTLNNNLIDVIGSGNMFLQWGESDGLFVTFCNDNSPTNNDWVGVECDYINAGVQQFFDSLC